MSKTDSLFEDYLDEDPEVPGQKYALISFISPENVLARKDQFFFERFLQNYEVNWKIKGLEQFLADTVQGINTSLSERASAFEKDGQTELADLCRKNYIKIDSIMGDYQSFVRKQQKDVNSAKINEDFKDFMFKEQTKLEDEFHSKNDFRTSVRGLKVRGVVRDEREAQMRVKKLQGHDKIHNIFMAEVGKWTPWDPAPHQIEDHEYAQDELNKLMKKYKENEQQKEQFFEEQKKNGRKEGAQTAAVGAKAIEVVSDDSAASNSVVEEPPSAAAGYGGIFDSPGDLAISRKMEKTE